MNAKKCKKLRKEIYSDPELKDRFYTVVRHIVKKNDLEYERLTFETLGLRKIYQQRKRELND